MWLGVRMGGWWASVVTIRADQKEVYNLSRLTEIQFPHFIHRQSKKPEETLTEIGHGTFL